jgi:hypothetical protein
MAPAFAADLCGLDDPHVLLNITTDSFGPKRNGLFQQFDTAAGVAPLARRRCKELQARKMRRLLFKSPVAQGFQLVEPAGAPTACSLLRLRLADLAVIVGSVEIVILSRFEAFEDPFERGICDHSKWPAAYDR